MNKMMGRWKWLLACWVLAASAAGQPTGSSTESGDEQEQVASFEEACEDEHSLVPLCDGWQCGMYRCREVMKHLSAGRVVRTWAEVEPLTEAGLGAQRSWGSAQELPWDVRPVFIIPWNSTPPPLLPSQLTEAEDAARERNKPHEKHHIFSQAFRKWFELQGINIDEHVIPLLVEKHRSIHRGANGGPWNAEWQRFIQLNLRGAPKEKIFKHAGQLIYQFELFGPVMPYWKRPPPLSNGS
jgi:uncharacterized lipoprotein (TIGR02269 family)